MKYTNETLHGLLYQHRGGGPIYRIIQVHLDAEFSHTTCDLITGKTVKPWIKLEAANQWIKEGTWILKKESSEVINNYQIY